MTVRKKAAKALSDLKLSRGRESIHTDFTKNVGAWPQCRRGDKYTKFTKNGRADYALVRPCPGHLTGWPTPMKLLPFSKLGAISAEDTHA